MTMVELVILEFDLPMMISGPVNNDQSENNQASPSSGPSP